MNTETRLQKIAQVKAEIDAKRYEEMSVAQREYELYCCSLVPYADRIKDLLKIAKELHRNGFKLGEIKGWSSFDTPQFLTDGIAHRFGFYVSGSPYKGHSIGEVMDFIGCEGGGCCGEDLKINADGRVVECGEWFYKTRRNLVEIFLKFEKEFYEYVDSL